MSDWTDNAEFLPPPWIGAMVHNTGPKAASHINIDHGPTRREALWRFRILASHAGAVGTASSNFNAAPGIKEHVERLYWDRRDDVPAAELAEACKMLHKGGRWIRVSPGVWPDAEIVLSRNSYLGRERVMPCRACRQRRTDAFIANPPEPTEWHDITYCREVDEPPHIGLNAHPVPERLVAEYVTFDDALEIHLPHTSVRSRAGLPEKAVANMEFLPDDGNGGSQIKRANVHFWLPGARGITTISLLDGE